MRLNLNGTLSGKTECWPFRYCIIDSPCFIWDPLSTALEDKVGSVWALIKVYGSFRPIRQKPGLEKSGKPLADKPLQLMVQRCQKGFPPLN